MAPQDFEYLIKDVLVASGFVGVSVTRDSQDGGIDLNAFVGQAVWPLSGLHLQVQAKRWLHTVGRGEVAELRGSLEPWARGSVITTKYPPFELRGWTAQWYVVAIIFGEMPWRC